jgi:hypothetical protein
MEKNKIVRITAFATLGLLAFSVGHYLYKQYKTTTVNSKITNIQPVDI